MTPKRPDLDRLIAECIKRVAAMPPAEREAMWKAQRDSWVRGEIAIGLDADEAKRREGAA